MSKGNGHVLSIHRVICKDSLVMIWMLDGKLLEHMIVLRSWN